MILHFMVFPCLSIAPLVSIIISHKTSSNQFQLSRTLSIVKQIFFNFKCSQGQYLYFLSQIQKWTIQNDHQVHHHIHLVDVIITFLIDDKDYNFFFFIYYLFYLHCLYIAHKNNNNKIFFFSHMMTFIPTFTLP